MKLWSYTLVQNEQGKTSVLDNICVCMCEGWKLGIGLGLMHLTTCLQQQYDPALLVLSISFVIENSAFFHFSSNFPFSMKICVFPFFPQLCVIFNGNFALFHHLMDRQTDGWTDSLCSTGYHSLWGLCPAHPSTLITNH